MFGPTNTAATTPASGGIGGTPGPDATAQPIGSTTETPVTPTAEIATPTQSPASTPVPICDTERTGEERDPTVKVTGSYVGCRTNANQVIADLDWF